MSLRLSSFQLRETNVGGSKFDDAKLVNSTFIALDYLKKVDQH